MIINPEQAFSNPIYKFVTSPHLWEFIIVFSIIYFILFKLKIFHFAVILIGSAFSVAKNIIVKIYIHFMLMAYEKSSGVDTSEYRKYAICEFRGIKCKHITNADTIIIEHIGFVKPIVIVYYFFSRIHSKFNSKRTARL